MASVRGWRLACLVLAVAGCVLVGPRALELAVPASFDLAHGRAQQLRKAVTEAANVRGGRNVRVAKADSAYTLSFALIVDESASGVVEWDLETALHEYLDGFLSQIQPLAAIRHTSQVLYFSKISKNASQKSSELTVADLEPFMSANDWNAEPLLETGRESVVHLMAYLPGVDKMHIKDEDSTLVTAFYVPRWGGVSILQTSAKATKAITAVDLAQTMTIFEEFIRKALGLGAKTGVTITSQERTSRAFAYLISATETLSSLSEYVQSSEHLTIVPSVAATFENATRVIEQALEACQTTVSYSLGVSDECLSQAREALVLAEAAFFDPTLIPQLYNPPEHYFAVFMPFLVPALLPILAGGLQLLRKDPKYAPRQSTTAKSS
mmetsp:Transcript_8472/g.15011  ORF Transcript_8472/g.15011 Transcript_8472/m.15011 type:complete len:381 (+) Transcript_8472:62-1204(+)